MKPIKYLGQNFLKDRSVVTKLIKASHISKTDVVLEIGPGKGILTKELGRQAKKVIAIEKDWRLIPILKETLKEFKNIEIIQGDILKLTKFPLNYKVVANIPFYITGHLIRKLLEEKNQPQEITLIIQKEVAQRICAKPPRTNILAISVQFYADAKIISYISKRSFRPVPKVNGAIIQITPRKKYQISPAKFFKVVKAGFAHPRKQLKNNLKGLIDLSSSRLARFQQARAETLSPEDWIKLVKML